jgi:hypothetical protein
MLSLTAHMKSMLTSGSIRFGLLMLIIGFSFHTLKAQNCHFSHDNGLLQKSTDVEEGMLSFGFDKEHTHYQLKQSTRSVLGREWLLKTPDTMLVVSSVNAWGIRRNGKIYRLGSTGTFELIHNGSVCIYRYQSGRSSYYYFSHGLDQPLWPLTSRYIKRVFSNDAVTRKWIHGNRWSYWAS